jgi:dephospho-CoA kinase
MPVSEKPAILVLTGASGAGKTTLLLKLSELLLPGVECINCDRVKLEPAGSDPSDHQAAILQHWLFEVQRPDKKIRLAVLDTQIRPHRAIEVLAREGIINSAVVLVDCEPRKRNERLHSERRQPELSNHRMDCWAAYLRGQADALGLAIIDTSEDSVDTSLEHLKELVQNVVKAG